MDWAETGLGLAIWTGLGFGLTNIKSNKSYKKNKGRQKCFEPMTFRSWDKPSTTKLGIWIIIFLHCFSFIQIYYMLHAS